MTRRRALREFPRQVTNVIDGALVGHLAGRSLGYSPLDGGDSDAEASGVGVVGSVIVAAAPSVADLFAYDTFTLASDGAQDLTLTFTAIPESVHVYLNGIEQLEGTDWTLSDTTLSVLAAMGALTADVVDVRYAYTDEITDDTETG